MSTKRREMSNKRLYFVWYSMIRRCENPQCHAYYRYGAIGRRVCQEWKDNYKAFEEWAINNGYQQGLSLDRIDNSKGYSPENCRWADRYVQQNNTRTNRKVTINGETHNLIEWARMKNLNIRTIYYRLERGMTEEEALMTPIDISQRKHVRKNT